MDELTPKERFLQSVERCARSEHFIPAFYVRFMATSDQVRTKFEDTDFSSQNQMLLRSLRLAAGATAGEPDSLRELTERAETHDRHHLNIEPRLYDLWLDSIIKTAGDFDDQWNETIEEAWRDVLQHVINHMIKQY